MTLNPTDLIGSYRIIRELGHGGMGSVYEAFHVMTGDRRAIKVFSLDHGNREFLRKRFLAEAKLLARLDHPRLVKVSELAIDENGETPYFVMDLVLNAKGEAETLEDVRKSGAVTEQAALAWYEDLRQGLEYIHSQGVVHRDVKLENVLVDANGRAVLSDFGVSRIFDEKVRSELMVTTTFVTGETTGTRPVMGTYWYLAPEIRRGGEATPASDWYALGVLMYRLLTGMWYEPGTNAFDLLAPFSKECQRIVRRLLSDDPAERRPCLTVPDAPSRRGVDKLKSVLSAPSRTALAIAFMLFVLGLSLWLCFTPDSSSSPVSSPSPSPSSSPLPSPTPSPSPTSSPTPSPSSPPPPLLSTSFSLHYCKGVDFTFRQCPAGTNMLGRMSIAVTRPYWLAEIPVTWRQWRAVRGESWEGGWNGRGGAPATYLTQDEATAFCAKLTRRFKKELPEGYEIRLPTVAEWRLAYQVGETVTNAPGLSKNDLRRENVKIGWFGQGGRGSNMGRYFDGRHLPPSLVTNVWPEFPPRRIDSKDARWVREASQIASVPVGLKPANKLGLHDMIGNCFEMTADRGVLNTNRWGASEFGLRAGNPYEGMGFAVTNPVVRTGTCPLMLGTYLAPDLNGDDVWAAPFDRLPHLGFRLCIGPRLN